MSHPIENIMKTTMEQIKEMVDVNTIVGTPVMTANETMVLPVTKVALGFVSGGGEYTKNSGVKMSGQAVDEEQRYPFTGASAAGMSITPMAFLSVNNGNVKVLPANYNCTLDRIIEMVPQSIMEIEKLFPNMSPSACDGKHKDEAHECECKCDFEGTLEHVEPKEQDDKDDEILNGEL